jgi:hypothetical protein
LEDLKVVAYDWQPTDLEKMAAFESVMTLHYQVIGLAWVADLWVKLVACFPDVQAVSFLKWRLLLALGEHLMQHSPLDSEEHFVGLRLPSTHNLPF